MDSVATERNLDAEQEAMHLIYLDCSSGVSGDMLLAALAHAVCEVEENADLTVLDNALNGLEIDGFELEWTEKFIAGVMTRHVDVIQTKDQPLRTYSDLSTLIEACRLDGQAARWAQTALRLLGEAEAKVHGVELESVHFHEIGAVDTIVDIVGTALLLDRLKASRVVASPIDLGSGFIQCAHGKMPVPAPACAELAKGLVTFGSPCGMERATPTGLSLLRAVAERCGSMPMGMVKGVGYGSGGRSSDDQPTYVRAFVLQEVEVELPGRTENDA